MDAIQQTTCNRRHARCNMRRRRSAGAAGDGAALLLTAGRVLRSLLLTRAVAHTLAAIRSARPCSHPCTLIILPTARPPMPGMLARLQNGCRGRRGDAVPMRRSRLLCVECCMLCRGWPECLCAPTCAAPRAVRCCAGRRCGGSDGGDDHRPTAGAAPRECRGSAAVVQHALAALCGGLGR